MTTFPGPYLYPFPCDFALPAHRAVVGDPPPGTFWACMNAGYRSGSIVLASPLIVATYLVQQVHIRTSPQDVAVTTHHWRWEGEGAPAAEDFLAVETRMNAFWDALSNYLTTAIASREYRWYGPRTEPGNWGDVIRVTPRAGTGGNQNAALPQQVACAVTERTDVRRRWGRFYIPNLAVSTLAVSNVGVFLQTFVTAVANAAQTMLGSDVGQFAPVVFGTPEPTSLPIRYISVDVVPDVQRRRRVEGQAAATVLAT